MNGRKKRESNLHPRSLLSIELTDLVADSLRKEPVLPLLFVS